MKKLLFVFAACLVLLSSFTFLKMNEKSDPKEVAYNYTVAVNKFDFEEAKKYSTEETKKLLDMLSSFASMAPDSVIEQSKSFKVEIKEVIEKGDKCAVMLTNGNEKVEKIDLIKENGIWKVHMSKDNMDEGGEAEKMDENK